jgi:hypothetical protein
MRIISKNKNEHLNTGNYYKCSKRKVEQINGND